MKNVLICALLLTAQIINAQTQGPLSGGSFTTAVIAGSNSTWISPSDGSPSDNNYTNFGNLTGGVGSYTDYLVATDFGFSIPSGSIITGILVEIERSDASLKTSDYSIRIVKAKAVSGAERSTGLAYTATDSYQSFGSSSDLWGETWTETDINDNGFGIAIAAQRAEAGGNTDGSVDDVRITVFYNFNTLPVTLLQFNAIKTGNHVDLKWTTMQESHMDRYEVQRSTNGRDFNFLTSITSKNQMSPTNYITKDNSPINGTGYYRLKMIGTGNDISYSRIVSVHAVASNPVVIYPSLWSKGQPLYIINPSKENLTVYFNNDAGQMLGSTSTKTGNVATNIMSMQKGTVTYKVVNAAGEKVGSGRIVIK